MAPPHPPFVLPQRVFSQLPPHLRDGLLGAYTEIVRNYAEGRWEPSELNGGKLSEVAYSICEGLTSGAMPAKARKPKNMVEACRALEKTAVASAPQSARVLIPRMLLALYDIRNNRSVGHVGGDVDPNHMDSLFVLQTSKWILGEFIRIFHNLPVAEAADLVEALVERETPLIWKVAGKKRVLDPKMSRPDKTLLLLHSTSRPVSEAEMFDWVEADDARLYRRDVIRRLHKAKLVEYDADATTITISPAGIAHVERRIIGTGK